MDPFVDLNPHIDALREKCARLPMEPGVYLMKNADHKIIYVGKAKLLKNRVSQYLHNFGGLTPKTVQLVGHINDFDYIVTTSEFEALLLECNLIKQYRPKYNILLKDDKGTHFIRITPAPWSRIMAAHREEDDGSECIGPFPSSYTVKLMVEQAEKIFRLPTCGRSFGPGQSSKPCLNYYIKQCYGPCRAANADPGRYAALIAEARRFLREGDRETVKRLTEQMQQASDALEFEEAARCRDRIAAIEKMRQEQNVVDTVTAEADVIGLARGSDRSCFAVIRIRKNRITEKSNHFVDDTADAAGQAAQLRTDFLLGFYAQQQTVPKQIFLDGPCADKPLLEQLLSQQRGSKVSISTPQKGEGVRMTEMAAKNALEQLTQASGREREAGMLAELSKLIGISKLRYIESYDVSNTAGADNLCGMVVFVDGKPFKANYRRFNIKGFAGQDDYESMRETVRRRYTRYQNHSGDGAFAALPDLILADGGQGQVTAVKQALTEVGLPELPVLGMVKDSRHRTRALVDAEGNELELRTARGAFTLVSRIQEEVHRYVITCHREKRSKHAAHSVLSQIPGIGPKRITLLMDKYCSIDAIAAAGYEELTALNGMSTAAADAVVRFFKEEY